ncbi:MAG: deoxyguanosinetriphosphate triphosphohydrolase [Hyphomicrobiales bacterium]|nr:MAG: deoxyguanosinetriphosphate triphosphohydrolase [Hyphomicrobiales bacterium]
MNFKPLNNESLLVSYAQKASVSRGRLFDEQESAHRSAFQRDRDRIIHTSAFRRLQFKTQVFVNHEGDHFRNRLTHTIEVAQIARTLSKALGLNEELAESLALSHDLGHTPFGHCGEDVLNQCLSDIGGFEHNAQSLKIVTKLERRYADFDGLNLTWEALEGLVKHNGPLIDAAGNPTKKYQKNGVPHYVNEFCREFDLEIDKYSNLEAQVAACADDVAYNNHDIDDGLRAGLFAFEDLYDLPIFGDVLREVKNEYADISSTRQMHEANRRLIGLMVEDILRNTQKNVDKFNIQTPTDVHNAPQTIGNFSTEILAAIKSLQAFLMENMYRSKSVVKERVVAAQIIEDLFETYLKSPENLPQDWQIDFDAVATEVSKRKIGDFIAGMTDRYAITEHQRLFASTPQMR